MHDNNDSYDLFKHSPLRYLGYANELGEAFRAFIPRSVVVATYVVATGYALGDAADKGYNAYKKKDDVNRSWNVADKTSDTLIWQLLASVTVPAYIINRTVHASGLILNRFVRPDSHIRGRGIFKLVPTLVGLATIPILPHVLDPAIDKTMDYTSRPMFRIFRDTWRTKSSAHIPSGTEQKQ
jgi:fission process protein 1